MPSGQGREAGWRKVDADEAGMEYLRQDFHSCREAGPWPREVARSIHGKNPPARHRRHGFPARGELHAAKFLDGLLEVIPARSDHDDFGPRFIDLRPLESEARLRHPAKHVYASSVHA